VKRNNLARTRNFCRLCKSKRLVLILDLGTTPLADLFVKSPKAKEKRFPLQVSVCKSCFLVQLMHDVDDELLFGDNYAFHTGGSPSSIPYFESYASDVLKRFKKESKRFTIEIASNDGTLLKHFQKAECKILGIDPAKNVAELANKEGIETLPIFFNKKNAVKLAKSRGKSGIVIANNVIAHVTDPTDFLTGVKEILDKDGVAIIECQYFPYLLFNNQFDNVYHEHRSFFSVTPLIKLAKKVGLKIFDVQVHDTQGGSIRLFFAHSKSKRKVEDSIKDMIKNEKEIGMLDLNTYLGFSSRINYIKINLISILKKLKKDGYRIAGYGASAKSNTILNYCNISTNYLDYIIDKTPYKFGLYTPGTHIPVVGEEKKRPDFYLLLVWNYSAGILRREEKFRKNGGKFIVAIPTPQII
jgi:2-polyprenyl-3-methyl-5-hydroxy-6-metoxy-1,4-benzoquinol methylase